MKRRDFIKNATLASSAMMVPNFLRASGIGNVYSDNIGKKLVVIQLSGGNDGLNTIVPFEDDLYYNARPKLGIAKNKVIKLNNYLGFNPSMKPLESIFKNGEMSVINSVGYPNPNRSHFRSMDIWETGSESHEYLNTGWLGRFLDHECNGCAPYYALDVNDDLNIALKGQNKNGFVMGDTRQLQNIINNNFLKQLTQGHHEEHEHENVEYLYKTMIDTQSSANYLFEKSKVHQSKINYPRNKFGKDLKQISELMTAKADIKIYYASLGGFDTHVGQKGRQDNLLKIYAESMDVFIRDLKNNKLFDDTLIMTFSEFGRRVKQNASNGTDHGTANNLFLVGGKLKKSGFYNKAPNLSDLDNGDLKYKIDFRQIYSEVINQWLDGNAESILGQKFGKLGIV